MTDKININVNGKLVENISNTIRRECKPVEAVGFIVVLLYDLFRCGISKRASFEEFLEELFQEARDNADLIRDALLRELN